MTEALWVLNPQQLLENKCAIWNNIHEKKKNVILRWRTKHWVSHLQKPFICYIQYLVQWQPVCFSPLDWAAAWCEWRAGAPASRCQIARRWTAARRSSDTPDWPHSSPSHGFALDDALHSLTARRKNTPATLLCRNLSLEKDPSYFAMSFPKSAYLYRHRRWEYVGNRIISGKVFSIPS